MWLQAEQSCAALKHSHSEALAGLRQRHEEELQRAERELEGRDRELQSARRERNALLSALRDADRRTASSAETAAGAAAAADPGAAAGGVLAHVAPAVSAALPRSGVDGGTHRSTRAPPSPTRHLCSGFSDADETAGQMQGLHASAPAHDVLLGDKGTSLQRSPLLATTNFSKAGIAPDDGGAAGKAAGAQAAMRGRQARRDVHAGEQAPCKADPVRSSSKLGKRARQDTSIASDVSSAFGPVPDVADGEGPPRRVAIGTDTRPPSGHQSAAWLRGAGTVAMGRHRISTHGDEACARSDGHRDCRGDYSDCADGNADVAVHSAHALPPQLAWGGSRPAATPDHSSRPQVPPNHHRPDATSELHATPWTPVARAARAAHAPKDHFSEERPQNGGAEAGQSSDSDAEGDVRMLRRAAHAARVPLHLIATGEYSRCAARGKSTASLTRRRPIMSKNPGNPAPVPLIGARNGDKVCAGDGRTPWRHHGGLAHEVPSTDPTSSCSGRGHTLRSMAQATGAWPPRRAASNDAVAQHVRAHGHAHEWCSLEWDLPVNASPHMQPLAAPVPPGSPEKLHTHDDASSGDRDSSRPVAPDHIVARSNWITSADSSRMPGVPAKHAQHALRTTEHAFRVTHHQPQPSVPGDLEACGVKGPANDWLMHEQTTGWRQPHMAAAEAQGACGKATLSAAMVTGQGAASPGEALAAAAPGHGVAREADGWRQGQAGGAGGFCSAVAQPPLLEGADRECMPCRRHASMGSVPELHSHVFLSIKQTAPARFDSNVGYPTHDTLACRF